MRAIRFALLLLLTSPAAWAENTTDIHFGCAPWDGQTLEIKVIAPDVTYKITVWGEGLQGLWTGNQKVDINNATGPNSNGSGQAQICDSKNLCHPEDLGVEFQKLNLQRGGVVKGLIRGTVPFEGTISQEKMFCG